MIAVMKDEHGEARWCDDVRTQSAGELRLQASRAFDASAAGPGAAIWGAGPGGNGARRTAPRATTVPSASCRSSAALLQRVAGDTPGDSYTVNVGHFLIGDEERPFANRHAPSLRAIYDLADLDRSVFMQSTGQSGNVLSPWYASFAERWAKVQYITIPTRRESIAAAHTYVGAEADASPRNSLTIADSRA